MVDDIPLDVANLLGFAFAMFLYGGYCIVFAITIRLLALRTRRGRSKVVFSTMLGLFLATTTTIILCTIDNYNGWIKSRNDGPQGTLLYFMDSRNAIRVTRDLLLLCAALMADGLICWRLLVIWQHNYWVLIFPVFLLVSEAVIGVLLIAFEYHQIVFPPDGRYTAFFRFGSVFVCVCSAVVNILVTSLISGRLWLIHRRVEGLADKDTYIRIIRVLVESGAIYTATISVFFVFVVADLPGAYRFVDYLVTVAVAIAPTLIVLQLNSSRKDDTAADLQSTGIEFHTPSYLDDDDERSSYRVASIFDVNFTDLPPTPATSRHRDRRRQSLRSPRSHSHSHSRRGGGSTPSLTAASTTNPRIYLDQPSSSSLRTTFGLLTPTATATPNTKSRLRKESSSQWSGTPAIPLTPLLRTSGSIPRMPDAVLGGVGSEVSLSPTTGPGEWVSHAERLASGERWTLASGLELGNVPPPRGYRNDELRVSTVEEGSREGSAEGQGPTVNERNSAPAPDQEEMLPPLPRPLSPRPSMSPISRPSAALSRPSISSLREGAVVGGHNRTRTMSSPVAEARPRPSNSSLREAVVASSYAHHHARGGSTSIPRTSPPPTSPPPTGPLPRPPAVSRPSNSSLREVVNVNALSSVRPPVSRPSNSSLREVVTAPPPPPRPPRSSNPSAPSAHPPAPRPSNSSLRESVTAPPPGPVPSSRPPAPGRRRQPLRERRSDLEQAKTRAWK